jgi:PDZ domain-containing protein
MLKRIKDFIKNNKGTIIILVLIALFFIKFDYVIYSPGGKVDLVERISISGENETKGKLQLSYVTMREATLPTAIAALIIPNWDMYPNQEASYDGMSYEDSLNVDKLSMRSAQDLATLIAYEKAGKEIELVDTHFIIVFIAEEANTDLKPMDEIIKINGVDMKDYNDVGEYITQLTPGDKVEVDVLRNNKEIKCNAVIYEIDGVSKIGTGIITTYDYKTNPEVKIDSKESESGPSGGLMTTLAIYNKLTKEDITKGRDIIGTGTINDGGVVGEIDGIKYKLLGAKGSDIFLCPKENEAEALRVKEKYNLKIEIKAVATFDEAVEYLMAK